MTQGDPAGIGPEVALKAACDDAVQASCELVLVGDSTVWRAASDEFGIPLPFPVEDVGQLPAGEFFRGQIDAECGRAAFGALMRAIELVQNGTVDGIVTAPLSKASLHLAGISEPGHTEILAKATRSRSWALMLHSKKISCVFATCHVALKSVPEILTVERVVEVASLMRNALLAIHGGREPRLALLGFNPHAGEGGLFGDEEIRMLGPAAARARAMGIDLSDPIPPDTAFTCDALARFDGHVCLYHDQGGIPFKMLAFDEGVNLTLGLPWVRTSPDHGTAFDIAWKGCARPNSMKSAILLATRLCRVGGGGG